MYLYDRFLVETIGTNPTVSAWSCWSDWSQTSVTCGDAGKTLRQKPHMHSLMIEIIRTEDRYKQTYRKSVRKKD